MLLPVPGQVRSRSQYGHLHECVVGDGCGPTWVATSGPGPSWTGYEPNPDATVLVTTRVVFDGVLRATPGDHITPEQATAWGVPQ